nr:unnamed protein product [Salmo salar]|eukprot:XP_013999341.1 PREDICTED: uncharacterized protein LOC106571143 isoform X2 [Salmo salar]
MVVLLEGSPFSIEGLWSAVRLIIRFLVTSLTKALHRLLSLAGRPALERVLVVGGVAGSRVWGFHVTKFSNKTCTSITNRMQMGSLLGVLVHWGRGGNAPITSQSTSCSRCPFRFPGVILTLGSSANPVRYKRGITLQSRSQRQLADTGQPGFPIEEVKWCLVLSQEEVCGTGLKSSEGCCVYIKDDQAWLKWDEKTTLRCDGTHYGNSDGECASNQSSLDCDGEISANTTPGTDTPGQQNTTQNGTPPASPRDGTCRN